MSTEPRLSILIIEDNDLFRRLAIEMLAGHNATSAKNAAEGVTMFTRRYPDITFLDIGLPDSNGHEVLKELKKTNPKAFVIMLTASNIKSDVKMAMSGGASGYIIKPFSRKQIKDSIDSYYRHLAHINYNATGANNHGV